MEISNRDRWRAARREIAIRKAALAQILKDLGWLLPTEADLAREVKREEEYRESTRQTTPSLNP